MNKEEIEKALKLFNRQDLIDDNIEDLDAYIEVFMTTNQMIYYSKLQQENKKLKEMIDEQDGCNKRRLQIFELKDKLCELQQENKSLKSIIKTLMKEFNLEPSEYIEKLLKGGSNE